MKISIDKDHFIKIENEDGGLIQSRSVEANLLFAILEKLEEIRCGVIDVEDVMIPPAFEQGNGRDFFKRPFLKKDKL